MRRDIGCQVSGKHQRRKLRNSFLFSLSLTRWSTPLVQRAVRNGTAVYPTHRVCVCVSAANHPRLHLDTARKSGVSVIYFSTSYLFWCSTVGWPSTVASSCRGRHCIGGTTILNGWWRNPQHLWLVHRTSEGEERS